MYLQNIMIASYNLIANHDLINYFFTVKYYDNEQQKMFYLYLQSPVMPESL